YTSLRPGQGAELLAGPVTKSNEPNDSPLWEIRRNDRDTIKPFALGPKRSTARQVEGWAHVMDRKICLALAMDAFARETDDRISTAADGRVTVWREFSSARK